MDEMGGEAWRDRKQTQPFPLGWGQKHLSPL